MNYRYNIGCSLSNLKGIRDFIRNTLNENHVSELQISAIVLALDEMCSNLMIHAHHCNPEHFLELHINHPGQGTYVFEIIDDGNIFDIVPIVLLRLHFSALQSKNSFHAEVDERNACGLGNKGYAA